MSSSLVWQEESVSKQSGRDPRKGLSSGQVMSSHQGYLSLLVA